MRDRDRDTDRERYAENGVVASEGLGVTVAGGIAIEELEAWILAIKGESGSEGHADAKSVLEQRHGIRKREQMVDVIDAWEPDNIPADARSLRTWMARARRALRKDA